MNSTVDDDNVVVEVAKSRGFRRQLFELNETGSHICDESEYATAIESESILEDNTSNNKFVLVDTFNDEIEIQPYRDECTSLFFLLLFYIF